MANAYLEWDGRTYWQKALNAVGNDILSPNTNFLPPSLPPPSFSLAKDWPTQSTAILLVFF